MDVEFQSTAIIDELNVLIDNIQLINWIIYQDVIFSMHFIIFTPGCKLRQKALEYWIINGNPRKNPS